MLQQFFSPHWPADYWWQEQERALNRHFPSSSLAIFRPSIDVSETSSMIVVHAELPGIAMEDINLDLNEGHLVLSGKKEERKETNDEKWHRVESSRGSFSRSILLPPGVTSQDINARHNNGVLEITIKKPAPLSPAQSIQITSC